MEIHGYSLGRNLWEGKSYRETDGAASTSPAVLSRVQRVGDTWEITDLDDNPSLRVHVAPNYGHPELVVSNDDNAQSPTGEHHFVDVKFPFSRMDQGTANQLAWQTNLAGGYDAQVKKVSVTARDGAYIVEFGEGCRFSIG